MATKAKPWYQSKTMIFNGVVGAMAVIEANQHFILPFLGASAPVAMAVIAGVNMILRGVTKQPVTTK